MADKNSQIYDDYYNMNEINSIFARKITFKQTRL